MISYLRRKRRWFISMPLLLALSLQACTQTELDTFKMYWNGGVNAVDAFSNAIQSNPNIKQSTKDKARVLAAKLDLSKPIIKALTIFPPSDRQALVDLLKETIPLLQDFAGDGSLGTAITIAAAAALAFFQTEKDMLDQAPPSGAARAPVNNGAKLDDLKVKLDRLKDSVKNIK